MAYTWNVAYHRGIGVSSVGRYRSVAKARKSANTALGVARRSGLWPDYYRSATTKAASCDALIGKLPKLFPPGTIVQSMDTDTRQELDVLTDEPTGRTFESGI